MLPETATKQQSQILPPQILGGFFYFICSVPRESTVIEKEQVSLYSENEDFFF